MVVGALGFIAACAVWFIGTYVLEWEGTVQTVIWIVIGMAALELLGLLRVFIDKRPFEVFETPYNAQKKNKETA
jgi:hypothetical protein